MRSMALVFSLLCISGFAAAEEKEFQGSSSRRPYARRWMTRILLFSPSTERNLVLGLAIGSDPLPMALDHRGKAFERLEPLPIERRAPVLEESPGPGFVVVAPELTEGLLEQVGCVQALVGGGKKLETLLPLERQILPVGEEGILLAP